MTGFDKPNYTQVPNALFERISEMRESELKVVLHAVRQTFGYHRESDAISLTQFEKATGLSRQGVIDGIAAATERGVLIDAGTGTRGVKRYRLLVNAVDQSTELTSTSQRSRPELVNAVDTQKKERKGKETTPTPSKPKATAPERKSSSKPYEDVDYSLRFGIINAWCSNLKAQPVGAFKLDANHETAAELHRAGYSEADVEAFVQSTQRDAFWHGKTLKLSKVAELIPAWKAAQKTAAPAPVPHVAPDDPLPPRRSPEAVRDFLREARQRIAAVQA